MSYSKVIKNTIGLLIFTGLLSHIIFGCKKYEEGPDISLKSKTSRISGKWKAIMASGDVLETEDKEENYFEFDKDGIYSVNEYRSSALVSFRGTWEWVDKKESIKTTIPGIGSEEWNILRLTKGEFWFSDESNQRWELEKE